MFEEENGIVFSFQVITKTNLPLYTLPSRAKLLCERIRHRLENDLVLDIQKRNRALEPGRFRHILLERGTGLPPTLESIMQDPKIALEPRLVRQVKRAEIAFVRLVHPRCDSVP